MNKPTSRKSSPLTVVIENFMPLLLVAGLFQIALSFSAAGGLLPQQTLASAMGAPVVAETNLATVPTNSPTNASFQSRPAKS